MQSCSRLKEEVDTVGGGGADWRDTGPSVPSLEDDGTCAGPLVDDAWVLVQPPASP